MGNVARFAYSSKHREIHSAESQVTHGSPLDRVDPISETSSKVFAGIVTYGARGALCRRVAVAALDSGVTGVVIVDNGASGVSRKLLLDSFRDEARVTILAPKENRGSAVGFGEAIEACGARADYIWLLDDDNVPRPSALAELIRLTRSAHATTPLVVFSRRSTDSYHQGLAEGIDRFPPPGSFMYFDLLQRVRGFRRIEPRRTGGIPLPYGPYGGLFARSAILQETSGPWKLLGLYEDDTEYTRRLAAEGARLLLCLDSVVDDIDGKWSEDAGRRGPSRFVKSEHERRSFLSVRNRTYVDRTNAAGTRFRYQLNRFIYLALAVMAGIYHRELKGLRVFLRAVRAGEALASRGRQSDDHV